MQTDTKQQAIEVQDGDFISWVYKQYTFRASDLDRTREVCITPYDGHYGPCGYVITVNGSPPRATILIDRQHLMIRMPSISTRLRHAYHGEPRWEKVVEYLRHHNVNVDFLYR